MRRETVSMKKEMIEKLTYGFSITLSTSEGIQYIITAMKHLTKGIMAQHSIAVPSVKHVRSMFLMSVCFLTVLLIRFSSRFLIAVGTIGAAFINSFSLVFTKNYTKSQKHGIMYI